MLVSKKWLSQATLISALALHGLTACSSDGSQEEGVSEEVGSDASAEEQAASAEPAKPEASTDVLTSEESEKVEEVVQEEPGKMLTPEAAPSAAPAPAAEPNPAPAASAAPAATGRSVFYVKSEHAVLRDQPAESGKEIGRLHKGDSVVAEVEGDWAKTSSAKFIAVKDLSVKPVGRSRGKRDWNNGGASSKKSH